MLALIAYFSGCTSVKVPNPRTNLTLAPAPYFDEKTGIYFPGAIGSLFRHPIINLENRSPGLGLAISYRSESARIDVFVYDLQASIIPTGVDAPVIQESFQQAIADVERAAGKRVYSQLQMGESSTREYAGNTFLHIPFTYTESLVPRSGQILLSGINSQILKIRATLNHGSDADMERFIAYLGQAIRQSQRNGYGGIPNPAYQKIRASLAQINLEDGLAKSEAISIAQIALVENDFHNRYDVSSATVAASNLSTALKVSFTQYPTQPERVVETPLQILVSLDGSVIILNADT